MRATSDRLDAPGLEPFTAIGRWREIWLFLAVAFGFAWLLWGYWVVVMPPGGLVISPAFIVCAIVGGFAPTFAAIAVTAFHTGRAGVVSLLATIRRPVDLRYVGLALVAVPTATIASLGLQQLAGLRPQWPDPTLLGMALVWPVMAALGEEFGWRAFLLQRLDQPLGLMRSALVIGIIWGLWHLPADYVGLKGYGDLFWLAFLINGPLVLTAHSIIMTWLWRRTKGSTLAAAIYHWSITACAIAAPSVPGQGRDGLIAAGIGVGSTWAVALLLLIAGGGLRGPSEHRTNPSI